MRAKSHLISRVLRNESGQVTVWTVGLAVLLFAMLAFAIDTGFWFLASGRFKEDSSQPKYLIVNSTDTKNPGLPASSIKHPASRLLRD